MISNLNSLKKYNKIEILYKVQTEQFETFIIQMKQFYNFKLGEFNIKNDKINKTGGKFNTLSKLEAF